MSWVQNWTRATNKIEARVGTELGMMIGTKFVDAKKVDPKQ